MSAVISGFINLLKPPGLTSQSAVAHVKRAFPRRTKVGHAGTLDPDVPGVLVICVGRATKLAQFLMDTDKAYRVEITFGLATDTEDWTGRPVDRKPAEALTENDLRRALPKFTGTIKQTPPMYSAVRVGGRRLYELAREGVEVPREAREVVIKSIELLRFWPGQRARALFDVTCGKGTYIRTLCKDIGEYLGLPAHMSYLIRTRVGVFDIHGARTLEEVQEGGASVIIEPAEGLSHLPAVLIPQERIRPLLHGVQPTVGWGLQIPAGGEVLRLVDETGELLALARRTQDSYLELLRVVARGGG